MILLPRQQKNLHQLGEDIKLARLRRKLSTKQVAERAAISRSTLWQIEKGMPSVAIGSYLQVIFVFGLEKIFLNIANDDVLGRKLQDAEILVRKQAQKVKKMSQRERNILGYTDWQELGNLTLISMLSVTQMRKKRFLTLNMTKIGCNPAIFMLISINSYN